MSYISGTNCAPLQTQNLLTQAKKIGLGKNIVLYFILMNNVMNIILMNNVMNII